MKNKFNFYFIIFLFIVIFVFLLNYKSNFYNTENFTNIIECSNCEIRPNDNECIKLYDISYQPIFGDDQKINDINNFQVIDISKILCPWKEQCSSNTLFESSQERLDACYNCCNNSTFYDTYTSKYSELSSSEQEKTRCTDLDNYMIDLCNNYPNKFSQIINDNNYIKMKTICDRSDICGVLLNLNNVEELNILTDPNLTVEEIINYQNSLSLKNDTQLNELGLSMSGLKELNDELVELNLAIPSNEEKKKEIQKELVQYFYSNINYSTKYYYPVNKEGVQSNSYLINSDQFYNCFGEIKNPNDVSLGDVCMNTLYSEYDRASFFDVSPDASYTTLQNNNQTLYPSYNDYQMELKSLNSLNTSNNSNNSNNNNMVSSYLQFINSFYTNQLAKFTSDNTDINKLNFIDNQLIISNPLKDVTYQTVNNTNCYPSITGNTDFSYCGVMPYNN